MINMKKSLILKYPSIIWTKIWCSFVVKNSQNSKLLKWFKINIEVQTGWIDDRFAIMPGLYLIVAGNMEQGLKSIGWVTLI